MTLTITLSLDNAAFEEGGTEEVARILAKLAERLPEPLRPTSSAINLHDFNGNHVGTAKITRG